MTLDEAIAHCEEVAEKARNDADSGYYDEDKCLDCAKEHEQLAEWLTELKAYKACPLMEQECYFCRADRCHNGGQTNDKTN